MSVSLVIGANGGIAQALITLLLKQSPQEQVVGVARGESQQINSRYSHFIWDGSVKSIEHVCERVEAKSLDRVFCCLGMLSNEEKNLSPEKRLEDIQPENLEEYFRVNTILPALWLKHIPTLLKSSVPTRVVLLSARVGSIEDNQLGGWYGYRASKAALNMMVKTAQVEYRRRLKNCNLVLYHPGTVDTALSKPFQGNVPAGKLFTPEFSAQQLLQILPSLNEQHAPHYIDWNGKSIPW